MPPRCRLLCVFLFAIVVSAIPCHADYVVYTFNGVGSPVVTGTPVPMSFQLTVSDFITVRPPWVSFPCSQLDSSKNCGGQIYFMINVNDLCYGAILNVETSTGPVYAFFFDIASFVTPGVHEAVLFTPAFNSGTLTVSKSVPEPSTTSLLSLALFGLPWTLRPRRAKPTHVGHHLGHVLN